MENNIITRFAPSPTGELHIGNVRSALFEYLFARHNDGQFLLRIEDTDRTRFVVGATERIIDSLNWLGIVPDNIDNYPVQSQRLEIYRKYAFQLVAEGKAYICTCSKEVLEADRKSQEAAKVQTGYIGRCRDLNIKPEDVEGKEYVIRMKMPKEGKVVVDDLIRGKVEFDLSLSDDQVILKSDGFPTYHLAAIVDDHEMEITHVIRGEEWLSSTPKHITLCQMLGFNVPRYAHLPMILAPDKTKLSKRHGATSLVEFKELGYLAEAIVNFIALLGWNPKDDREIFSLNDLEKEFKIENVNKAPAVFNIEKLNSINEYYIKSQILNLKSEKNEDALKNYLKDFGVTELSSGEAEIVGRGGYKTLKEAADYISNLRVEPQYDGAMLVFKKSDKDATLKGLEKATEMLVQTENTNWNQEYLQSELSSVASENDLTNGDIFWPVRVALSGAEKSPSPIELLIALGKEKSIQRLEVAVSKLS